MAGDWSANPLTDEPGECCTDASCLRCQVKAVGARTILEHAGESYDAWPPGVQKHYRELAGEVFADMSEALIARGLPLKETTDAAE